MSSIEEERKPAADPSPCINLKVSRQNVPDVFFKIRRNTHLKKLMNAYCEGQSVDLNTFVFLFEGRKINPERTPHEMEMEDGDEIDAMLHADGGGVASTWWWM